MTRRSVTIGRPKKGINVLENAGAPVRGAFIPATPSSVRGAGRCPNWIQGYEDTG